MQAEHKQRLRDLAAIIAVALALLWPAFVNGEPFYMADTPSYLRGADGAIHELTGASSAWSDELQKRFADDSPALKSAEAPHARAEPAVVLKGRSIYYGALLYAAQWFGNFWAVAILQALLCAVAIMSTVATSCRAMGRATTHLFTVGVGVGLAAFTPMGYFASYLLPDVFGGLGLLAVGHLLFFWNQQSRASRLFWFALLALATLFHTANILLVTLLALAGAIGLAFRLPASKQGLAAIASTVVIGLMGQVAFSWGVEHATGAAPVRPPFLAARIIDDGPGYDYLRAHCPEIRLIFCRSVGFRTRESATLLWSDDPHEGIFQALPPAGQRMAAAQQTAFLVAVAKERPFELIRSSAGAFFRQLGYFKLESFNYTGSNNHYFRHKLPEPFLGHARQSRAYQQKMPVTFVEWATVASVLASLVLVALTVRAIVRRERKLTPVAAFLLLLVLGILINAAICGAFSTPRGRYQMRLIWVLPLAALATCRVRMGRAEAPGASAGAATGGLMTRRFNRLAIRETAGQLLRFGMATGLSAIVSLGLPAILHELFGVDPKVAVGISQATVLLMNFVTLRLFVFRGTGSVRGDLMRYFGSAAFFRGLEYLSFLALFELAGLFYLTALVITLVASTLIKFVWYRFLFGRNAAPVG